MATIGTISFDVILRAKDGSHETVVGELEIPIRIETGSHATSIKRGRLLGGDPLAETVVMNADNLGDHIEKVLGGILPKEAVVR